MDKAELKKQRLREAAKRWYHRHKNEPEVKRKHTERARKWREKNREHYNEYQKEYKRKIRKTIDKSAKV